ncbi:MAG: beta-propeller domain-containing protein [Planctomycetia bacterium]
MAFHRHPRPKPLTLERLEARALLTATISRGSLAIRGTAGDDAIEVRRSADDSAVLQVIGNGELLFSGDVSAVRQIRIDGGDGHDEISVNQESGPLVMPVTIRGGRGRDLLQGGGGLNRIDGGAGRDAFQPGGGDDRVSSASRIDRLSRVGTAAAFRDYLINAARNRDRLGVMAAGIQTRLDAPIMAMASTSPSGSTTAAVDSAPGHSQTNTQVAGVDEGDIIENDGRHLYVLSRNELLIVDAQDPDSPAVVSRTTIEGSPLAEYLHDGTLTVVSSVWTPPDVSGASNAIARLNMRHAGQVQVTVFDVADPTAPRLVSSTRIDGAYVDSRMVAGRLALVLQNDLLAGYWGGAPIFMPILVPDGARVAASPSVSDAGLARQIRQAPLTRMLPTWTTTAVHADGTSTTSSQQLVSHPQDVLCPATGEEVNLTSIVLIDVHAARPGLAGATSVIGGYASSLHMNAEDLYVFSPRWESLRGERTDVQRFDITGAAPRFVASGSFAGHLLNQFSADDHGDFLRVAVTNTTFEPSGDEPAVPGDSDGSAVIRPIMPWNMNRSNAIHVLATQGDSLAVVGSVADIAPGESIMSARFVGDRAYLVTFEQVDPLFVIDLSTPTAPRIAGELKVPGFSRFLQPLDEGFLLGIGRDADPETGRTRGLKVSLFDVRDASAPTEVDTYLVDQPAESWSWSNAEWDHHALGFFPELDVVALPVQSYAMVATASPDGLPTWQTRSGVVVLDIDPATGITELGTVEHDSHLLRTARIGSTLYSVADLDLHTVDVGGGGLTPRGTAVLQPPYETIYATF